MGPFHPECLTTSKGLNGRPSALVRSFPKPIMNYLCEKRIIFAMNLQKRPSRFTIYDCSFGQLQVSINCKYIFPMHIKAELYWFVPLGWPDHSELLAYKLRILFVILRKKYLEEERPFLRACQDGELSFVGLTDKSLHIVLCLARPESIFC